MDASERRISSRDKLIAEMKAAVMDAQTLLEASGDESGESYQQTKERLAARLPALQGQFTQAERRAMEQAEAAARVTDEYVHGHPWPAIAVGVGAGLLLGLLIVRR